MKKTIETESIVILTYKDPHAAAFNRLNRAWLEEHALLEDGDRKQLEQPRESILAKGGEIFIAVMGEEVVGSCAVIPPARRRCCRIGKAGSRYECTRTWPGEAAYGDSASLGARSWGAESDPPFFDKTTGCAEIVRASGVSVWTSPG
jgi:hypothetical protein